MDVETIVLRDAPALQHLVATQSPAEYLAPEQIQGRPLTEKTDVYGFGVTLYEMVAGRPPFEAPARDAVVDLHLTATPPRLRRSRRTVPVAIEAILVMALEKRPEQRPFMPKVLNHIATEAGTGTTRPWKRTAALAAGIVLAAAVAAPIAWSVLTRPSPSPPDVAAPRAVPAPEGASTPPPVTEQAPTIPADPLAPAGPEPTVTPPPTVAAPPPSVAPPPPSVVAPSAVVPLPAPPAPRAARGQPPRPAPGARRVPATAAPARPAPARDTDEPDPADVIDWLLNRRND
jgi:serine/threonine-protein kinase